MKAAMKTASRGVLFYHVVALSYTATVNDMTLHEILATRHRVVAYNQMLRGERLLVHRLVAYRPAWIEDEHHEQAYRTHALSPAAANH